MNVTVDRLQDLPLNALAPLVAQSERTGWRFLQKLLDEWATGANRFDKTSTLGSFDRGFRVASVGGIPEPSTALLAALACGMIWLCRKRFKPSAA
jgi:hypothetical protein